MKFTVATPSFKQLDWLRLCIASVADQASSASAGVVSVEHFVQDAGTPGIEDFARETGAGFPVSDSCGRPSEAGSAGRYSLAIASEPDGGMYDAINRGFRRGAGEICGWLNCDEQYLPGALPKVAAFFQAHPAAEMVLGDTILLDGRLEPRSYRRGVPPPRDYVTEFQLNVHSSSLFFRRRLLDRGFWLGSRFRSIGDSEWIVRLLDAGVRIHRLGEPLSTFFLGEDNLSARDVSRREKETWRTENPLSGGKRRAVHARYTLRRIAAGACLPRWAGASIFTPDHLAERKNFSPRWLDFRFRT